MTTGLLAESIPVERVALEIITTPEDVAFVSGSIVEGFGNENSDLDLFLVRSWGEVTADPRLVLATVGLGETYIDYEVYNEANMAALAALINGTDVNDFRAVWSLPISRLDLYYRVAIAEPAYNPEGLERLKQAFSKDGAAARLAAWAGLRSAHAMRQARVLLGLGDGRHAYVAAQNACGYAVDSVMAREGEAYPNLKWRFEKVRRRFGVDSDLYQRAWSLKALGDRSIPEYIEAVAAFCRDVGMETYESWGPDDLRLGQARDARAFRVAGRHYIVQNRTFIYELSVAGRYAWDALDGSVTRRDVVANLQARFGWSEARARRELTLLLRRLEKHNLLREA
jgi:uncharacterized protein involved in tellurium resistance